MTPTSVAIDARLILGTSTGDSTYWSGLLGGLQKCEGKEKFLLFARAPKPQGLELGPNFEWITLAARSSRWWSLVRFPLAARRSGAKVLHTQYSLSPLAGKRGITTIHDVSFLIGPEWFKPRDRLVLGQSVPLAIKRAAKVLAVSDTCKAEIESFFPGNASKIAVTPNACPDWIQPVDREVALARVSKELGLETPFLLTVGTRWPRKNMNLAIDAAEGLQSRFLHSLAVTGKFGWGDDGLGKRGRAVGYVSTDLLSCLYSAADLYLAPSRHEGFGIPLLESFRCGCPVVCSSGGALPEVAGDAAVVMKSWDARDWSASIEMLLDDPSKLKKLKQRGLEREKLFTWEATAQKTLKAYREVAE